MHGWLSRELHCGQWWQCHGWRTLIPCPYQRVEFTDWLSRDQVARNFETTELSVEACLCIPIGGIIRSEIYWKGSGSPFAVVVCSRESILWQGRQEDVLLEFIGVCMGTTSMSSKHDNALQCLLNCFQQICFPKYISVTLWLGGVLSKKNSLDSGSNGTSSVRNERGVIWVIMVMKMVTHWIMPILHSRSWASTNVFCLLWTLAMTMMEGPTLYQARNI